MSDDSLRRKKVYEDMISGKVAVDLLLEDELDEHEGKYSTEISFIGDSMSEFIVVTATMRDKDKGTAITTGSVNITRPHFNLIVAQLGRMKSTLNTLRGENK